MTSVHLIDVNEGVILARRGVLGIGDDRQKGICFAFGSLKDDCTSKNHII